MNSEKKMSVHFEARYRKFLLTFTGTAVLRPDHAVIKAVLSEIGIIRYWCMCDEINQNGFFHTHLFILLDNSVPGTYFNNKFPDAHIITDLTSVMECIDYVRKQGIYNEKNSGEINLSYTFEDSESSSCRPQVNYRMIFFDIVFLSIILIFFLLGFFGVFQQYLPDSFLAYCFIVSIVFLVGDLIIMGVRIWKNRQLRKKK